MFIPNIPAIQAQLPNWAYADVSMRAQHGQHDDAPWLIIHCAADELYPAILAELRQFYKEPRNCPGEWFEPGTYDLRPEWGACLAELDRPEVTAYWLETAYQFAKMDLQCIVRRLQFEIRMHGGRQKYGQRHAPPGRDIGHAAGTYRGEGNQQLRGMEARQHYRRLRGVVPG